MSRCAKPRPWKGTPRPRHEPEPDASRTFPSTNRFHAKTKHADCDDYDPRTIHESSLSPCVHATLAAAVA